MSKGRHTKTVKFGMAIKARKQIIPRYRVYTQAQLEAQAEKEARHAKAMQWGVRRRNGQEVKIQLPE